MILEKGWTQRRRDRKWMYSCMGINTTSPLYKHKVSLNPKDAKCVSAEQNAKKNHSAEFLSGIW